MRRNFSFVVGTLCFVILLAFTAAASDWRLIDRDMQAADEKKVLIFNEADSLMTDRRLAKNSWERTQTKQRESDRNTSALGKVPHFAHSAGNDNAMARKDDRAFGLTN